VHKPQQTFCSRAPAPAPARIRQHTSAYVSIRQHTSAYVSIRRQHAVAVLEGAHHGVGVEERDTSPLLRGHHALPPSACVSIGQHWPA
jgi:hypothetical protein